MFTKFAILEITHEEYCIMKLINFLNHGSLPLNNLTFTHGIDP